MLAAPNHAMAQSATPGIRGYLSLGMTLLAARDSFDAVAQTSRRPNVGGGVSATLWRGTFVDVAFSQITVDGERVFVNQGTVFRLGIPLSVTMRPLDIAGGWRFGSRVAPYVGAGLSRISYKETSRFADPDENLDQSGTGLLLEGGVDVEVARWLHLGGELRYRDVKAALGAGGVSAIFGDDSIGGLSTSIRVSVGR